MFPPALPWEIDICPSYINNIETTCSSLNNDLFRNHILDNPLCDLCGVVEDATHYYFHCIKYSDERQVISGTVRAYHPLNIDLIIFAPKTGILKLILSCSGLSIGICTHQNAFSNLF